MPIGIEQLNLSSLNTVLATEEELQQVSAKISNYNITSSNYNSFTGRYEKITYTNPSNSKKYLETQISENIKIIQKTNPLIKITLTLDEIKDVDLDNISIKTSTNVQFTKVSGPTVNINQFSFDKATRIITFNSNLSGQIIISFPSKLYNKINLTFYQENGTTVDYLENWNLVYDSLGNLITKTKA
jgi:hypothetical protein